MTVGEKIHRTRKANGFTQEELATRLKVSRQAVSRWELNEVLPDTENLIQLCKILNISIDALVDSDCCIERPTPMTKDDAEVQRKKHKTKTIIICVYVVALIVGAVVAQTSTIFIVGIIWAGIAYLIYLFVLFLKRH